MVHSFQLLGKAPPRDHEKGTYALQADESGRWPQTTPCDDVALTRPLSSLNNIYSYKVLALMELDLEGRDETTVRAQRNRSRGRQIYYEKHHAQIRTKHEGRPLRRCSSLA